MGVFQTIVGIDVSKSTLDVCVMTETVLEQMQIKNEKRAIAVFFKKLKAQNSQHSIVVGLEHTGLYNWPLYDAVAGIDLMLHVINPIHLKRSMGLVRGKNDRIDAKRIAEFIATHKHKMKPTLLPRKEVRDLQVLVTKRKQLVEQRKAIKTSHGELKSHTSKSCYSAISMVDSQLLETLDSAIKQVEHSISKIITQDDTLKRVFQLITSVPGVGKVLGWNLIIKTNEFKSINDPRKLACYAGVVPFENQSGTSIYRKPRVSFMADKTLKKLLHLAALRVIQLEGEMRSYYLRKVGEGKHKMSVLNALRNKIVARICAVIKNQKTYLPNLDVS
jgi:transposase